MNFDKQRSISSDQPAIDRDRPVQIVGFFDKLVVYRGKGLGMLAILVMIGTRYACHIDDKGD